MSNAQLVELLHDLRLAGFREELEHQLQNPQYSDMPVQDRILRMLQAETENGGEKVDHGSGGMSPLRAA